MGRFRLHLLKRHCQNLESVETSRAHMALRNPVLVSLFPNVLFRFAQNLTIQFVIVLALKKWMLINALKILNGFACLNCLSKGHDLNDCSFSFECITTCFFGLNLGQGPHSLRWTNKITPRYTPMWKDWTDIAFYCHDSCSWFCWLLSVRIRFNRFLFPIEFSQKLHLPSPNKLQKSLLLEIFILKACIGYQQMSIWSYRFWSLTLVLYYAFYITYIRYLIVEFISKYPIRWWKVFQIQMYGLAHWYWNMFRYFISWFNKTWSWFPRITSNTSSLLFPYQNDCGSFSNNNASRESFRRIVVSLPFKQPIEILNLVRNMTLKRFSSQERCLALEINLKTQYVAVMKEYKDCGHTNLARIPWLHESHYSILLTYLLTITVRL